MVKDLRKGLPLCIDSWRLDQITILNRYPLPLMNNIRNYIYSSKLFTKIDLKAEYNLIRIHTGDELTIAFYTRYKPYKYLVIRFRIADALASIQNMINKIFKDITDLSIIVSIDDIRIFS
jgi:hypothetical protein